MNYTEVKSSELKTITEFIIKHKVILHPLISPNGVPDFSKYEPKNHIIIIDRNLWKYLFDLVKNGTLKDDYKRTIIASLLFWSYFNGFTFTSGLAIMEYAHFKNDNTEANQERNIFLEIFNFYSPNIWLDLALGRRNTIPKLDTYSELPEIDLRTENDHYKMHFIEMLKISQLYFDSKKSVVEKLKSFYKWNYEELKICRYTTFFALLLFSENSKMFKNTSAEYDNIEKKCINQAWDLTYLSSWSTFYWHEENSNDSYLFATNDKELRELFILTNTDSTKIFQQFLGQKKGHEVVSFLKNTHTPRKAPTFSSEELDQMICLEKSNLSEIIANRKNTRINT